MARYVLCTLAVVLLAMASPVWGDLLGNPSFEDGLDLWTETGEVGTFSAVNTPAPPTDGALYLQAQLDAEEPPIQTFLTQEFTVPAGTEFIGVDMGYAIVNPGPFGTGNGVSAIMRNPTTSGEVDLLALSNALPGDLAGYWRVYVTDISAFEGEDVVLEFSVWTIGDYNSQEFAVDNIRYLTPAEAAAALAPEPTTLALVALPALLLLRRRRR